MFEMISNIKNDKFDSELFVIVFKKNKKIKRTLKNKHKKMWWQKKKRIKSLQFIPINFIRE